jgi:hypothetical protein
MKFRYQKFPLLGQDPPKPLVARPLLPVFLVGKKCRTPCPYYALLDSGADRVIFPAELAGYVGINVIETGSWESAVGIAGQRAAVYYHQLSIEVVAPLGPSLPRSGSRARLRCRFSAGHFSGTSRLLLSESSGKKWN